MIEEIISIARKAGRIIIDVHESGDLDISVKKDNSPITRADYASNEYIQSAVCRDILKEYLCNKINNINRTSWIPF